MICHRSNCLLLIVSFAELPLFLACLVFSQLLPIHPSRVILAICTFPRPKYSPIDVTLDESLHPKSTERSSSFFFLFPLHPPRVYVTKKLDFQLSPATLYVPLGVVRLFVPALCIATPPIDSIRRAIRYRSVARNTLSRHDVDPRVRVRSIIRWKKSCSILQTLAEISLLVIHEISLRVIHSSFCHLPYRIILPLFFGRRCCHHGDIFARHTRIPNSIGRKFFLNDLSELPPLRKETFVQP